MTNLDVLGQVVAQRDAVARRLESIRRVVAVSSGKGGVGKSALTANLAVALSQDSLRVGVLDADIHGPTAALMLGARGQRLTSADDGVQPAIGVADVRLMSMDLFLKSDQTAVHWRHPGDLAEDAYVWRGALEANVLREFLADTAWGGLDLLLVDMPPGADRFDTLLRLVPGLAGVVIVTAPGAAAQLVVRRAISAALDGGARLIGVVENMATDAEDGGAARELAQSSGSQLLGRIPYDAELAARTDAGRPLALNELERVGPVPDAAEPATRRALLAVAARLREALDL